MWRTGLLVVGLLGMTLFNGCAGPKHGSRPYQPLPKWESKFLEEAKRDVFPNDVREAPERFQSTLVVWTGVIKKVDYFTDGKSRVARITAQHHYFDFLEDTSVQRERFFMSPRGEGFFSAVWRAETTDDEKFLAQFTGGDMLIAYGHPSAIDNNVIVLFPTENIRSVKPQWYRTDVLEYGRTQEPKKILKSSW